MSNTAVGQVYKRVIDAVVDASKTDFEESGVQNNVLELLRDKWQEHLTHSHRAFFPWDPQPAASPPGNAVRPEPTPEPSSAPSPNQSNGNRTPQIKQENTYDNHYVNMTQSNQITATQRAAYRLHQEYGPQATRSINALQAADQTQRAYNEQHNSQRQHYESNHEPTIKQESAPVIKQEATESSINTAQTDGSADAEDQWTAVLTQRHIAGQQERCRSADHIIRAHIERNAERFEGGGLMVPLEERLLSQRKSRQTIRKAPTNVQSSSALGVDLDMSITGKDKSGIASSRFDGSLGDSDDEDAINSDLDDPEETNDNITEGLYDGDVILCLYDKVQRVKNKWKCSLKDGVASVEGKDYVFHKAQGEFEW